MDHSRGRRGLGSLATGAITGLSLMIQAGLAAVVGVVIARQFGRNAETDGFFAAYGVFVVLALAANAIRLVVLPPLARARADNRLGQETAAWSALLAAGLAPVALVALVFAEPVADFLTGEGPELARATATDALPLIVVAGIGQVYAGLLASALAALDDYRSSAIAFIISSSLGLTTILVRLDTAGVAGVAAGMVVNAVGATVIMAAILMFRARRASMPASGIRPAGGTLLSRGAQAVRGLALPLALQGSYLMCLPLAAHEGVGAVTTFGYAYLAASMVVAATAASFGLVTAVPLTRIGLDAARVARHIVATSWLALLAVGATAGAAAVAGEQVFSRVLGTNFLGAAGAELGNLIATFAPWMVATVGITVTLPLMFVAGRGRPLPFVAFAMLAAQAPLAFVGQRLFGLAGLAVALAISTCLALAGMLWALGATAATFRGLAGPTAFVAGIVPPIFLVSQAILPDLAAAAFGIVAYAAATVAIRPRGLMDALRYLKALE